jgi:hypothetical protein
MATMVLTSEFLSLGGNDLSAYLRKCELAVEVEEKDVTTMASLGWKAAIGGLKSGTLAIEVLQDFATGLIDSIMWPLLGTVSAFEVRPTSAVVGVSNPKYTGSVLIKEWAPFGGSVGDEASVSVSYPTSGAVTRATT